MIAGFLLTPILLSSPFQGLQAVDATGTLVVDWFLRNDVGLCRFRFMPAGASPSPSAILLGDPAKTIHHLLETKNVDPGRPPLLPHISADRILFGPAADVWIDRAPLAKGEISIHYPADQHLYGMRATSLNFRATYARGNPGVGLMRDAGAAVKAGAQGDGGAPLAYTTKWGLLIDSVDGQFTDEPGHLTFSGGSRKDLEFFIAFGAPKFSIAVATALTGPPPMPPRWSLGFMNSQWGTDEKMVDGIVDEYRARRIPLDAFIFDFDFKAWGEDDYGEWRWNSTNGLGNVAPMKYPDGASGAFARKMAAKGVKLVGIMKPRILIKNVDGSEMKAAAVADANHWWLPGQAPYNEYFSHRPANDLNFAIPACRDWYWQHAKGLFDTGIVGWWNDEADEHFDSLGFFHMQQSLYEGQRRVSRERVWSLNRNFYLGAQRFGFGTWSGDIRSGFASMAAQTTRMLATVDLAQPHWSMDTGGFGGHPDPENYARWIEFASVVPIMRVHGTYGEHRQPWVYGPVAEAAAKRAIEWRYAMIPSLYSWEHEAHRSGVGIVRPLFWEFPDDPGSANVTTEWMLGPDLLVAPVLEKGATEESVYLPPGIWIDYRTAQGYAGGQSVAVPVDATAWQDVPMFVRQGAILASQQPHQFEGEKPVDQISLDVWADPKHLGTFTVYDDDGHSYGYERGAFFSQAITVTYESGTALVKFSSPNGRYRTSIKTYRVRLHGPYMAPTFNGTPVPSTDVGAPPTSTVDVVVPAGHAGVLKFSEVLD